MHEEEKYFLALTDQEEYWDKNAKKIIFLGEWCCRYSRKEQWEGVPYEIFPYLWEEKENIVKAREYIFGDLYDRVLTALSDCLNSLHNQSHATSFWDLAMGSWIKAYLSIVYSKYCTLKQVLDKYPNIYTYGIAPDIFKTPNTITDLFSADTDMYFYTRILLLLNKDVFFNHNAKPGLNVESIAYKNLNSKLRAVLTKIGKPIIYRLLSSITKNRPIVIRESYCRANNDIKLALFSNKKIGFTTHENADVEDMESLLCDRKDFYIPFFPENDFERILIKLIVDDIPKSFIENYKLMTQKSKEIYPQNPQIIISATEWHWNDMFKIWGATMRERGAIIAEMQHGGNYGSVVGTHKFNYSCIDKFITWGWSDGDKNISKGIAAKLMNRKKENGKSNKSDILFVTTSSDRINDMVLAFPRPYIKHVIERQLEFLDRIDERLKPNLLARPYFSDYGWDLRERYREVYAEIRFQEYKERLPRALRKCRLYVCDHLSTTFLEALYTNVPTVLFWEDSDYDYTEEAKPYYNRLKQVGILYNTAEEAAKAVNLIYDTVDEWWNEKGRQDAVKIFCSRFAYVPQKPINGLVRIFEGLNEGNEECN